MPAAPRFTPLSQSDSSNGFGPIIGDSDLPTISAPPNGPIDYELVNPRFSGSDPTNPAKWSGDSMDIAYDANGNLLAVTGAAFTNQQVAKAIQSAQDPNSLHPLYGTVLATAVGQKRTDIFTKDIIVGNVRDSLLRLSSDLAAQPGVTADQLIIDVQDVFAEEIDPNDTRTLGVVALLLTKSGNVLSSANIVSI